MLIRKVLTTAIASAALTFGYTASTLAAQDTDTATAVIATALAINWDTVNSLDFGSVSPGGLGAGPGTVDVNALSGAQTATNVGVVSAVTNHGVFNVSGCNGCAYAVTASAALPLDDGLGNTMAITFTSDSLSGTYTLDGTGADTVYIGGSITVNEAQPSGTYTTSYTVTVNYN